MINEDFVLKMAFINPNSTETMTKNCANSFAASVGSGFEVRAVTTMLARLQYKEKKMVMLPYPVC